MNKTNQDWFTSQETPDPKGLPVPTGWRILIRPVPPVEKTKGGIILTDTTKDNQSLMTTVGRVVSIGPLAYTRDDMQATPQWCKVGDFVIFGKYAGLKLEVSGVKYLILNDDEVLAVTEEPDAVKKFL